MISHAKQYCLVTLMGLASFFAGSKVWAGAAEEPRPSPIHTVAPAPVTQLELPKPSAAPDKAAPETAPAGDEPKDVPQKRITKIPIDQVISEKASFYFYCGDIKKTIKAYQRTALAGLLAEGEMSHRLEESVRRLREAYLKGDGALTELAVTRRSNELDLLERLWDFVDDQAAFAILPSEDKTHRFVVVLSLPLSQEDPKKLPILKTQPALMDLMERHQARHIVNPRFNFESKRVGEYEVESLTCPELDLQESWAFVENLFIYGQGKGVVEDAIKACVTKGPGTMIGNDGYNAAYSVAGTNMLVYMQADPRELLKNSIASLAPLKKLTGLIDFDPTVMSNISIGMNVGEGENAPIIEKFLLKYANPALAPHGTATKAASVAFAAKDVLYYRVEQGSLGEWYKHMIEQVVLAKGPDLGEKQAPTPALDFCDRVARTLNCASREELFKKLDIFKGEIALTFSMVPQERSPVDQYPYVWAFEFPHENRAQADDILNSLTKSLGFKDSQFNNVKISSTSQDLEKLPGKGKADSPVFAAFCIVELQGDTPRSFLLASDSVKALKKALLTARPSDKFRLDSRQDYKQMLSVFNESRHSLTYLDLPHAIQELFQTLLPSMIRSDEKVAKSLVGLPTDTTITRHLSSPMAWASTTKPEGELVEINSPCGNLPLLAIGTALFLPILQQEEIKAVSKGQNDRLKEIAVRLQLFAAANDRFPASLSELADINSDLTPFASPFSNAVIHEAEDLNDQRKTNLIYVANKELQGRSNEILLYEDRPTQYDVTTEGEVRMFYQAVHINGQVKFYPEPRLRKLLAGEVDFMVSSKENPPASQPKK